MKKTDDSSGRLLLILLYLVFFLYLLLMTKIILFKYCSFWQVAQGILTRNVDGFRSCNLIPFYTVKEFTRMTFQGQFLRGFANLMGNLLIFAPLGYFLPLLFRVFQKPRRVLLFAVLLSVLFEILQYVLYLGSADIDDVILNTAGAMIGCGTFYGLQALTKHRRKALQKVTLTLSALCFLGGALIAVPHFGVFLGIRGAFQSKNDPGAPKSASETLTGDTSVITSGRNGSGASDTQTSGKNSSGAGSLTSGKSGSGAGSLLGYITSFTEDGFIINKITTQDLDNGGSIAMSGEGEHQELILVRVAPDAVYREKKIYDMYGSRIEQGDITKDDLAAEDMVELQGQEENGVFTATEVVVNSFPFMK